MLTGDAGQLSGDGPAARAGERSGFAIRNLTRVVVEKFPSPSRRALQEISDEQLLVVHRFQHPHESRSRRDAKSWNPTTSGSPAAGLGL
jgi:hypothetical protein